jgi:hypothetical protein
MDVDEELLDDDLDFNFQPGDNREFDFGSENDLGEVVMDRTQSKVQTDSSIAEMGERKMEGRYIESYPGNAAVTLGQAETPFQQMLQENDTSRKSPWHPFADEEELELVEWLLESVNKNKTQSFLHLPIVSE